MIPKFRAWHKEQKIMRDVIHIIEMEFFCVDKIPLILNGNVLRINYEDKDMWQADKIELMQWSGLTDCESKDIYEGDILVLYAVWGTDANVIERSKDTGQLQGRTLFFPSDNTFNFDDFDLSNRKIEGNIYENENLLKETENELA